MAVGTAPPPYYANQKKLKSFNITTYKSVYSYKAKIGS